MKRKSKAHISKHRRRTSRYLLGVIAISFVTGLIFFIIPSKRSVPCANTLSCSKNPKFQVENNALGIFQNRKIIPPNIDLSLRDVKPNILGDATSSGEKHIYVDLTSQTLTAAQGNTVYLKTLISSGKWRATPTGDYRIWIKLRATRMSGGSGDDYYDLPNVPYTMFFSNDTISKGAGFSLHGAYWHNNFGHPMSHGCINMRPIDAKKLYDWANPETDGYTTYATSAHPGTTVTVYGQAPI